VETETAQIDAGPSSRMASTEDTLRQARVRVRALSPAGLVLAAVALGGAVQVNFGQYHFGALRWLTVALMLVLSSVAAPRSRLLRALDRNVVWVIGTGLCLQFILLLSRSPGATGALAGRGATLWPFHAGILIGACLAAGAVLLRGRAGRACLFAMLLTHAALGTWVLRAAPNPGVDVIVFQRDASRVLLHGENPYAITFPNPYSDPERFYAPGAINEGRLNFGYPYPPLSLLMALPGYVLGDFRYAQLAAMTAAGALVALARPGRIATAAAAVLVFTPRGFFVLEAGWTEPFGVLLLAATVFVACRRPKGLPVPLGLLFAVKQYLVLGLFLVPLLPAGLRRKHRPLAWKAVAVAAFVTLPLALWDLPAFVRSAVLLQFRQPFREDSLSYLAGLFHETGWRGPAWIAFAITIPTIVFCLRRCPRTPAGFAAALGLACFAFFAFNKQAFCNYYHLVIGALCCAAGASAPVDSPTACEHENTPDWA
jgi:hypothetical protein